MSFKILSQQTISPSNNVVVFGGGPSVLTGQKKTEDFMASRSCTTISSNRFPPYCQPDFMLFIDNKFFKKCLPQIKSENIIIGKKIKINPKLHNKHNFFILQYNPHPPKTSLAEIEVQIFKNGKIPHLTGGAGFASILVSTMFQPKNLFIIGFDGPDLYNHLPHYDNNKKNKNNPQKMSEFRIWFKKILMFVRSKNITIHSCSSDRLWDLNKHFFDIQIH